MEREIKIQWQDSVADFQGLLQQEPNQRRRQLLHALILLRSGLNLTEVQIRTQLNGRKLRFLLSSYHRKGAAHAIGYIVHPEARLTINQQRELIQHAQTEGFVTLKDAIEWIKARWGIHYSIASIRYLFSRLEIKTLTCQRRNRKLSC